MRNTAMPHREDLGPSTMTENWEIIHRIGDVTISRAESLWRLSHPARNILRYTSDERPWRDFRNAFPRLLWKREKVSVLRKGSSIVIVHNGLIVKRLSLGTPRYKWLSAAEHILARERCSQPDPNAPDTLGWRAWTFYPEGFLTSPYQGTPWKTPELRAHAWSDEDAIEGIVGIHARRMPYNWRLAWSPIDSSFSVCQNVVTGIVERFGRAVIGPRGWRAEIAIIRELLAPSTKIALALMRRYPDVKVHIREEEF